MSEGSDSEIGDDELYQLTRKFKKPECLYSYMRYQCVSERVFS